MIKETPSAPRACHGPGANIALIAMAAITLAVMIGCDNMDARDSKSAEAARVTVAFSRVARTNLSQTLRIAAEFLPYQEIDVHAKIAGYVKDIYVDIGYRVEKGQVLAILEAPELRAQLNQAEASAQGSADEVKQSQSELKRAESLYRVAHLTFGRLQNVAKTQPNLIAQQEVDEAEGKDQAAKAQVEAAKAHLAAAQEHQQAAAADIDRIRALLDYTKITAPFDGVITKRYADTGAMLAAGTTSEQQALPLVRLSQNQLLRLEIPVPEDNVPDIGLHSKVSVQVSALSKTFQGTVARFDYRVDPGTRTMITELDIPNPNLEIVPGMYAYASFPIMQRKNILVMPIQAVIHDGDRILAYRISDNNQIEIVPILTGMETRDQVQILSGLAENDRVVVANTGQLRPGEVVTPRETNLLLTEKKP